MSIEGKLARTTMAKSMEDPGVSLGQNTVIPPMHFEVTPGIGGGEKQDKVAGSQERRGVFKVFGRKKQSPDIAPQTSQNTAAGKDEDRSESERNGLSDEAIAFIGADNLKSVRQDRENITRSAAIVTSDDPFPHAPDRIRPIHTIMTEVQLNPVFNTGREHIYPDAQRDMRSVEGLFHRLATAKDFPKNRAGMDSQEFDAILANYGRTAREFAARINPRAVELEKRITSGQEDIQKKSKKTKGEVKDLRKREPKMDTESVLSAAEKALHDMGDIVAALPPDDLIQAGYTVLMYELMSLSVDGVATGGRMDRDRLWAFRNAAVPNFDQKGIETVARELVKVAQKSAHFADHHREDSQAAESQNAMTKALNASDQIRTDGSEAYATLVNTVKDNAAAPLAQMSKTLQGIQGNLTTYLGEQGVQQDDPERLAFAAEIEGYLKKQAQQLAYGYTRLGIDIPQEIASLVTQVTEQPLRRKLDRQENSRQNGGHPEPKETVEVTKEVEEVARVARRALVADFSQRREPDERAKSNALRGQDLTGLERWLLVKLESGASIGEIAQALDAINRATLLDPEIDALKNNDQTKSSYTAVTNFIEYSREVAEADPQRNSSVNDVLISVVDRLQNLPADAREGISKRDIAFALGGAGGENAANRAEVERRISDGLADIKDYLKTGVIAGEPVEVYPGEPPEGYDRRGRKIGTASAAAGGQQQVVDQAEESSATALEDAGKSGAESWQEKFLHDIGQKLDKTPAEKLAEREAQKAAIENNLSEDADQQAFQDPEPDKAIAASADTPANTTTPEAETAPVQIGSGRRDGGAGDSEQKEGDSPEPTTPDDEFSEQFDDNERAHLLKLMDDPESVTRTSHQPELQITFRGGQENAVNEALRAERLGWDPLKDFLRPWEDDELFRKVPDIPDPQLVELLSNLNKPKHDSRRTTRPDRPSRSEPIFYTDRIRWAVMLGRMPDWTLYQPRDSLLKGHYVVAVGPFKPHADAKPETLAVCEAGQSGNATYGLLHVASWEDTSKLGKQEVRDRGFGFKENHNQPDITDHHGAFFDKAKRARKIIDTQREKAAARAKEPVPVENNPKPEGQPVLKDGMQQTAEPQEGVPEAKPTVAGETPLSDHQQESPAMEAPHASSGSETAVFSAPIVKDARGIPSMQPAQPAAAPVDLESAPAIEPPALKNDISHEEQQDQRQQQPVTENHTAPDAEAIPPVTQPAQAPVPEEEMPERQAPPVTPTDAPESKVNPSDKPEVPQQDKKELEPPPVTTDAPVPREEAEKQPVPPEPTHPAEPEQIVPSPEEHSAPEPEQDLDSQGDAAAKTFNDLETNGNDHGRIELPEPSRQEPPAPDPVPSPSQDMGPDTSPENE